MYDKPKPKGKSGASAEKERMRLLQQRIDVASQQRQIELDLEKSFQAQISSLGEANGLLQARISGTEEEFNYQNQINKLVEQFGEEKRPQFSSEVPSYGTGKSRQRRPPHC